MSMVNNHVVGTFARSCNFTILTVRIMDVDKVQQFFRNASFEHPPVAAKVRVSVEHRGVASSFLFEQPLELTDVNECTETKHTCHETAQCYNVRGSYWCACVEGGGEGFPPAALQHG